MEKLDRWAEDRRVALETELKELDAALKEAKRAARLAPTLPEKLDRQREARKLETKRDEAWRAYDQASRDLDGRKLRCSTRSAGASSSTPKTNRCSRCAGAWRSRHSCKLNRERFS